MSLRNLRNIPRKPKQYLRVILISLIKFQPNTYATKPYSSKASISAYPFLTLWIEEASKYFPFISVSFARSNTESHSQANICRSEFSVIFLRWIFIPPIAKSIRAWHTIHTFHTLMYHCSGIDTESLKKDVNAGEEGLSQVINSTALYCALDFQR